MSNWRHGHARQDRQTPSYRAWANMVRRCEDRSYPWYRLYGGRGIRVCVRWRSSFQAFLADMGERPVSSASLDRVDVNADYSPKNCRWATAREQASNRRNTIWVYFRGRRMCLKEAATLAGLRYRSVWARVSTYGWTTQRALSEPLLRPTKGV